MAGSKRRDHGSFPRRRCASSYAATAPGTVTDSGPSTFASFLPAGHPYMPDRVPPPKSSNISGRDASGARVDPSNELDLPSRQTTRPAIPPSPLPIGDVTPSAKAVARAASSAFPPSRRISTPASAASGSAVTMPLVATASVFEKTHWLRARSVTALSDPPHDADGLA